MAKVMAILMGIIEVKEKCARVKVSDLLLRSKTFNSVEFLHGSQIGKEIKCFSGQEVRCHPI